MFSFAKMKAAIDAKKFDKEIDGHSGPPVRGRARGQGAGRSRPAAHPVRRQGLRLHLALPRLADRQVEDRHLEGRGQDRRLLLDRPPDARPRATRGTRPASTCWRSTSSRRIATCPSARSHPEGGAAHRPARTKMELLYDFPTYPEPHYAQIIARSKDQADQDLFARREHRSVSRCKSAEEARVVRKGNRVDVYMLTIRTHFTPDIIRVAAGRYDLLPCHQPRAGRRHHPRVWNL